MLLIVAYIDHQSFEELNQDSRHVIFAIRHHGLSRNVLVEEVFQHFGCRNAFRERCLELLKKRIDILLVFPFPNAITRHYQELLSPVAVYLVDFRLACDRLLVVRNAGDCFFSEVSNGSCQVEVAVDSTVNDFPPTLDDSVLFTLQRRLMIFRQTDRTRRLHQRRPGVPGVGNIDLGRCDEDYVGSASGTEHVFCHILSFLPLTLVSDLLSYGILFEFQIHIQLDESLFESPPVVFVYETFPHCQLGHKVVGNVASHLAASVPIEDCEQGDILVSFQIQLGDLGVLHVLPPTLHLATGPPEFVVGAGVDLLGSHWFRKHPPHC